MKIAKHWPEEQPGVYPVACFQLQYRLRQADAVWVDGGHGAVDAALVLDQVKLRAAVLGRQGAHELEVEVVDAGGLDAELPDRTQGVVVTGVDVGQHPLKSGYLNIASIWRHAHCSSTDQDELSV